MRLRAGKYLKGARLVIKRLLHHVLELACQSEQIIEELVSSNHGLFAGLLCRIGHFLRLFRFLLVVSKCFVLYFHNLIEPLETTLVLLHLRFELIFESLSLRHDLLINDLKHILPLFIKLFLDFDDLLVRMPNSLSRTLLQ